MCLWKVTFKSSFWLIWLVEVVWLQRLDIQRTIICKKSLTTKRALNPARRTHQLLWVLNQNYWVFCHIIRNIIYTEIPWNIVVFFRAISPSPIVEVVVVSVSIFHLFLRLYWLLEFIKLQILESVSHHIQGLINENIKVAEVSGITSSLNKERAQYNTYTVCSRTLTKVWVLLVLSVLLEQSLDIYCSWQNFKWASPR